MSYNDDCVSAHLNPLPSFPFSSFAGDVKLFGICIGDSHIGDCLQFRALQSGSTDQRAGPLLKQFFNVAGYPHSKVSCADAKPERNAFV